MRGNVLQKPSAFSRLDRMVRRGGVLNNEVPMSVKER